MTVEGLLKLTRRRIGTIVAGIVLGVALAAGLLWMTPSLIRLTCIVLFKVFLSNIHHEIGIHVRYFFIFAQHFVLFFSKFCYFFSILAHF